MLECFTYGPTSMCTEVTTFTCLQHSMCIRMWSDDPIPYVAATRDDAKFIVLVLLLLFYDTTNFSNDVGASFIVSNTDK